MMNNPKPNPTKTQCIEQTHNQIAQDIHDSLAQTVVSIQLRAEVLERNLHRYNVNQEILNNASKIKQDLRRANQEIRSLIQNFRSPQIEDFQSAIHDLIKKFKTDSTIKIFLQYNCVDDDFMFDVDVKTNIYRIIQESLTNIKKHSKAQFVRVMLTCSSDILRVLIEDDGVGFWTDSVDRDLHFGLSVMQERAQQISGNLEIESEPEDGCRIKFSIHKTKDIDDE